jgi:YVTN family beta-propeller protein
MRCLAAATILLVPMMVAAQGTVWIVQTNSAGDNVHIIDPVTNTVVGEITGIERAHGAAPSPDGRFIYVANESTNTVDVVDVAMLKVTKKIELVGRPNNIAATPDGRKVYVAIAQSPGALQVIDTATNEITATISVHGGVHNTYVTPDGKFAVAGTIGARNITVVDTATDMPVWATYWDLGIRPMTFDTHPDGSTRRIYAQLSNFNGFGVLDFDTRKEVDRIEYPEVPDDQRTPGHGGNTAHGIGVTRTTTIWSLTAA